MMASKISRINTLKACFSKEQQRPTAVEIHRWIEETMQVKESELLTLQLVGKQNSVFMKFVDTVTYEKYLRQHAGTSTVTLLNGETTTVIITPGDVDLVTVRVLNLPPEVPNDRICNVLKNYGTVQSVVNEKWATRYRYTVDTGIRIVQMHVANHIPSNLIIANFEAYITYVGQEQQCFLCGDTSHIRINCPQRVRQSENVKSRARLLFSDLLRTPTLPSAMDGGHHSNDAKYMDVRHSDGHEDLNQDNIPGMSHRSNLQSENDKEVEVTVSPLDIENGQVLQTIPEISNEKQTFTDTSATDSVEESDVNSKSDGELKHGKQTGQFKRKKHRPQRGKQKSSKNEDSNTPSCSTVPTPLQHKQDQQTKISIPAEETAMCVEDQPTTKQLDLQEPQLQGPSWNEEMANEQDTVEAGIAEEPQDEILTNKSQKSSRHRTHPYKSEVSKLGFPLLRKIE